MHKNVEIVAKRSSITSGVERIRKVKVIAGEKRTETIHKENGLRLKLDINKVFFSPRLGNERLRIESQVQDDETVVDMFAGIGPFSILIAKRHLKTRLYAIDINKHAIDYLKENTKLNKVGNIVPFFGDAKLIANKLGKIADRIIMNLPMSSMDFLGLVPLVVKKGAIVHLYCLAKDEEVDETVNLLKRRIDKIKILSRTICAEFGPGLNIYCFDLEYS